MPGELTTWTAIVLIAIVTFCTRIAGPILMSHIQTSEKVEQFLDSMSVSVVAALIASILLQGGMREIAAVSLSVLVMFKSKSAIWAMVSGIGVAAAWSAMFSL